MTPLTALFSNFNRHLKPRILIITYAYLPAGIISAMRPYTWAKHLVTLGFDVTVLTRHWAGSEKKISEMDAPNIAPLSDTVEEGVRVIRLPFENKKYLRHLQRPLHARIPGAVANIFSAQTTVNSYNYEELKSFLRTHLARHKYAYVIITTPPGQYIKLGAWINKRYDIPFWADMRDYLFLFDTIPNTIAAANPAKRILLQHSVRQIRQYCSYASVVSAPSAAIAEDLQLSHPHRQVVIMNGFDEADDLAAAMQQPVTERFTISILGTLYPKQDITAMLAGFSRFLAGKEDSVAINFIGTGSDEALGARIKAAIGYPHLHISCWQPRADALAIVGRSNVLYYIGWSHVKGIYSGKIFEYLGAYRNILVSPGDHDVVEALMQDTGAGKTADSPEEMAAVLDAWYGEWKGTGTLRYAGNPERIAAYSRRAQAEKVAEVLRQLIQS